MKSVMFFLYNIFLFLFSPFIIILLLLRIYRNKEEKGRISERFGITNIKRPKGSILWIHTASIGEMMSASNLITICNQNNLFDKILLTTQTKSAASLAKSKFGDNIIHQYIVFDYLWCIKKFLNHWKPNMAIFFESELWPNIIYQTSLICKIMLINASISDKSYKRWMMLPAFAYNIFSRFCYITPQSYEDEQRIRKLSNKFPQYLPLNIEYIGNLKYDIRLDNNIDTILVGKLKDILHGRKCWVAASIHEGEESFIIQAHDYLNENLNEKIVTIIVPRHPNKINFLRLALAQKNYNIAYRSQEELPNHETDFYIIDSFGELMSIYQVADIALIGGSLIPHGGHNLLEAASSQCAIICGPFMTDFVDIVKDFKKNNAIIGLEKSEDLSLILYDLMINNENLSNLSKLAYDMIIKNQGNTDKIFFNIKKLIQ